MFQSQVWDLGDVLRAAAAAAGRAPGAPPPSKKHKKAEKAAAEGGPKAGGAPVALRVSAAVAGHDKDINSVAVSPNDALVATGA